MRKFVKNNILDLISTMFDAHKEVKASVNDGKQNEVQTILLDCQNAALNIGATIEECESEDAITIKHLEDYCNIAYDIVVNLLSKASGEDMKKLLDSKLLVVKNSVEKDLKVRLEVVFFPYNASMWDSLESIWKDYKKDPDVDTYVVPIPYCDKNPDGSAKKWYYDRDEYPDSVPTLSWEDYDIENRRPDIVYIHNPYDDCNTVTSVHPKFYSSNLKQYTEELIYVPYFVTLGAVPAHLTQVPAIFNADKVLVATKEDKEVYVDTFISVAGEAQRIKDEASGKKNEAYWEALKELADTRFVVFGSPKVRKLKETTKDQFSIPENWTRLIKRPGKPDRKVFLYNTSISALLNNPGTYLQKVMSVLECVKRHDQIVLLWRPHPLLQSTLDAMLPEMSDIYRKIVENYKNEGYGIFDESSDVTRAVVLSDAYYGDGSSIVALFNKTGKHALIQSPKIICHDVENKFDSEDKTFEESLKNKEVVRENESFTLNHFLKLI